MSKPIAQAAKPDPAEIEAARANARQFAQELAGIDQQIMAKAVEAGRTTDEACGAEILAERDALIKRRDLLPGLLRGARSRYLQLIADGVKAQAAPVATALASAQAEAEAATAEFDATAAALERASARLKAAEARRDHLSTQHWRLLHEASAPEIDAARIAQGLDPFRPDWFVEPA